MPFGQTRVRWSASRRRVPTEAVVFPSGTTESRGGGRVSLSPLDASRLPPRRLCPYPWPGAVYPYYSTPTGANSQPRGAQSSTGRRSLLFLRYFSHSRFYNLIFFLNHPPSLLDSRSHSEISASRLRSSFLPDFHRVPRSLRRGIYVPAQNSSG